MARLRYDGRMQIPDWFPTHPPIYDIEKSYLENATEGPFFDAPIPDRPKTSAPVDFFGCKLNSPLGIPAGPLLNARWIALAAKLGFDLLVYKTIRSFAHPGHALPNMIYVKPAEDDLALVCEEPKNLDGLMLTNSFGMPSRSPEFLLEDIDRANRSLGPGQAMIVSIVGTPNQGVSFVQDFVRAAELAKEAGAKFIEANLSCPNVGKAEGQLYTNPEAVYQFAHAIVRAIHPIPLILKTGVFPSADSLRNSLEAAARAGAGGICGINSVSYHVVDGNGNPALGAHRLSSGVCGAGIRKKAVDFLQTASLIIRKEKLDLELLGCGGVVKCEHFDELLSAGAKIAMSATGMMWDPFLALRHHWKKAHDEKKTHTLSL